MAEINCPECKKWIEHPGAACPYCGYPFQDEDSASKGLVYRFGQAIWHLRRGEWDRVAEVLLIQAWLGRYLGFVSAMTVGFAAPLALPLEMVVVLFLYLAVGAAFCLPISIFLARSLLSGLGFSLRAESFKGGFLEGLGLGVFFLVLFMVYRYTSAARQSSLLVQVCQVNDHALSQLALGAIRLDQYSMGVPPGVLPPITRVHEHARMLSGEKHPATSKVSTARRPNGPCANARPTLSDLRQNARPLPITRFLPQLVKSGKSRGQPSPSSGRGVMRSRQNTVIEI